MKICFLVFILLVSSILSISTSSNLHYSNSSTELSLPDEFLNTDVGKDVNNTKQNLKKRLTPDLSNEYAMRGNCIQRILLRGGALNPWISLEQVVENLWNAQEEDINQAFILLGAGDGNFMDALGINPNYCVYYQYWYPQHWVNPPPGEGYSPQSYEARYDLLIDFETGVVIAVYMRPMLDPVVPQGQAPPAFAPVRKWSDIAWLSWLYRCSGNDVAEDQKPHCLNKIEWVIFSDPSFSAGQSGDVMVYLNDPHPPPWPGNVYDYTATGLQGDNTARIIGSPNGLAAAWLASSLFGSINAYPEFSLRGMIDRVHWFTGTNDEPLLAFHISKSLEVRSTLTSQSSVTPLPDTSTTIPGALPISVPVLPIVPVATVVWTGSNWETSQFPDTWTMDEQSKPLESPTSMPG